MNKAIGSLPRANMESRTFWLLVPAVALAVFISQTWPFWDGGNLLPGTEPDGPFHYFCELVRLSPAYYAEDLAVETNRGALGYYEVSYGLVLWLMRTTGWSLLEANLVLNWTANVVYLAGIMVLFRRMQLPPWTCALGALLAVQPHSLIGTFGLEHSLAIPREVWFAAWPWLLCWHLFGRREKAQLVLFYGTLGLIYGFTYPLWAILLGIGFGLRDAWDAVRKRSYADLAWLAGGALVCLAFVVLPSLATMRVVGATEGAVLEYNQRARLVYTSTGFRRFLVFVALGAWAYWMIARRSLLPPEFLRRLRQLWLLALAICLVYEPFQRLIPALSLLYFGRLSVFVYLGSIVCFVFFLHHAFRSFPAWGKVLAMLAVALILLDPQRSLARELRQQPLSLRRDFVQFCRLLKERTKTSDLFVIPPLKDSHYFRVHAQRGLWISPKDLGILSRSRVLYELALQRRATLERFYDRNTSRDERERTLQEWKNDGVDYLLVETNQAGFQELSWPIVFEHGKWQLRSAPH